MIISGATIAHKLLSDGKEIDDNVSCQLPSIEMQTSELKGAGILGTIDMPITGQVNGMTFSVIAKSINKNISNLAKPDIQNLELRYVKDVFIANGSKIPEGTKIYITGINKKYDPGKIEIGSNMDGSIDFEVIRYRQVINGVETLLIDKRNFIFSVNGVDYMKGIKTALA
jgi:hypothetical protein